jgi:hypothetical protein
LLLSSVNVPAQQETTDYFVGKWELLLEGTPSGDVKVILSLERKEGKLEGSMTGDDTEEIKFDSVDESNESITLNWYAEGYDVYLSLKKKDEDNISGMLMDMFHASGQRLKE